MAYSFEFRFNVWWHSLCPFRLKVTYYKTHTLPHILHPLPLGVVPIADVWEIQLRNQFPDYMLRAAAPARISQLIGCDLFVSNIASRSKHRLPAAMPFRCSDRVIAVCAIYWLLKKCVAHQTTKRVRKTSSHRGNENRGDKIRWKITCDLKYQQL